MRFNSKDDIKLTKSQKTVLINSTNNAKIINTLRENFDNVWTLERGLNDHNYTVSFKDCKKLLITEELGNKLLLERALISSKIKKDINNTISKSDIAEDIYEIEWEDYDGHTIDYDNNIRSATLVIFLTPQKNRDKAQTMIDKAKRSIKNLNLESIAGCMFDFDEGVAPSWMFELPEEYDNYFIPELDVEFIKETSKIGESEEFVSLDQEITSKDTAHGNGKANKGKGRVPAIYKNINIPKRSVVLDYGCGEYTTSERVREFLGSDIIYADYDKYNRTPEENKGSLKTIKKAGGADIAICANVLNVISSRDVRVQEVITNIYNLLKDGGVAYFDVYADKSKEGPKQTGKDKWQEFRSLDSYLDEVSEVFGINNVSIEKNTIKAVKNKNKSISEEFLPYQFKSKVTRWAEENLLPYDVWWNDQDEFYDDSGNYKSFINILLGEVEDEQEAIKSINNAIKKIKTSPYMMELLKDNSDSIEYDWYINEGIDYDHVEDNHFIPEIVIQLNHHGISALGETINEGKSDYDYRTGSVNNDDIFDKSTLGGFSDYAICIPGNKYYQYAIDNKNKKGEIVMMSPNEYYEKCATKIFDNTSVDGLKQSRRDDLGNLADVITVDHKKFPMCFISYADKSQEGLHRMMVAGDLFGWDHKFPVLVINHADPEIAKKHKIYMQEKEIEDYIIEPTLRYNGFYDIDDLLDSINSNKEYYDMDEAEIIRDGNNIKIKYKDAEIEFPMKAVEWDEDSPMLINKSLKEDLKDGDTFSNGVYTVKAENNGFGYQVDSDHVIEKVSSTAGDDSDDGIIKEIQFDDDVKVLPIEFLVLKHNVKELILPDTIKAISRNAIWGNRSLERIYVPDSCDSIDTEGIGFNNKNCIVSIPDNLDPMSAINVMDNNIELRENGGDQEIIEIEIKDYNDFEEIFKNCSDFTEETCYTLLTQPWEAFDRYDYCSDSAEEILQSYSLDNYNKGLLREIGFNTKEELISLINSIRDGSVGVEGEYDEFLDELESTLRTAVDESIREGSLQEAHDDIVYAIKSSLPGNVEQIDDYDEASFRITISNRELLKEMSESKIDPWEVDGYDVLKIMTEMAKEKFNFYEPRNGWYGDDPEAFNDYLSENFDDIKELFLEADAAAQPTSTLGED